MDTRTFAEWLSLTLTVPTLLLSAIVLAMWLPVVALKKGDIDNSTWWLVAGVCTGFFGSILDNAYWSLAWGAVYINHNMANDLMHSGVYFNIFSRQTVGTIAAYCHLHASRTAKTKSAKILNYALMAVSIITVLSGVLLLIIDRGV